MEVLSIGDLARRAGVNIETVRYYERRGLLDEPPRTPAGYRQYSADDLWRLEFIGRAKRLGFTLGEIRDVLGGGQSATEVLDAARAKLDTVKERQHELVDLCRDGDPGACTSLDLLS